MSDIDIDDVMLELLIHQGFLVKQTLPNGKVYYKRTDKPIPPASDNHG